MLNKLLSITMFVFLIVMAGQVLGMSPLREDRSGQSVDPKTAESVMSYLKSFNTTKEKIVYIADEAREFIKVEKYQDAKEILEYALKELDADSVEIKDLMETVKNKIQTTTMPKINPEKIKF